MAGLHGEEPALDRAPAEPEVAQQVERLVSGELVREAEGRGAAAVLHEDSVLERAAGGEASAAQLGQLVGEGEGSSGCDLPGEGPGRDGTAGELLPGGLGGVVHSIADLEPGGGEGDEVALLISEEERAADSPGLPLSSAGGHPGATNEANEGEGAAVGGGDFRALDLEAGIVNVEAVKGGQEVLDDEDGGGASCEADAAVGGGDEVGLGRELGAAGQEDDPGISGSGPEGDGAGLSGVKADSVEAGWASERSLGWHGTRLSPGMGLYHAEEEEGRLHKPPEGSEPSGG